MRFANWMDNEGIEPAKLSEETGISISTISRLKNGQVTPTRHTMEIIYKASKGLVSPNDWYDFALTDEEGADADVFAG